MFATGGAFLGWGVVTSPVGWVTNRDIAIECATGIGHVARSDAFAVQAESGEVSIVALHPRRVGNRWVLAHPVHRIAAVHRAGIVVVALDGHVFATAIGRIARIDGAGVVVVARIWHVAALPVLGITRVCSAWIFVIALTGMCSQLPSAGSQMSTVQAFSLLQGSPPHGIPSVSQPGSSDSDTVMSGINGSKKRNSRATCETVLGSSA